MHPTVIVTIQHDIHRLDGRIRELEQRLSDLPLRPAAHSDPLIWIKLTEHLAPSGTAKGSRLSWDGITETWQAPTNSPAINVRDGLGWDVLPNKIVVCVRAGDFYWPIAAEC